MKMYNTTLEKIRKKVLKLMWKAYGKDRIIEETVSDSSTIIYHTGYSTLRIKIEDITP